MSDLTAPQSETLRLAAAACKLAREIWMARNDAFEMNESWQLLSPAQRDIFIRQAADVIKAHAPIRSKVIGHISETEAWGERHV